MKKSILAAMLVYAFSLHANPPLMGGQDGNGGDGVTTADGQILFLDLVREADQIIDLDAEGYTAEVRELLATSPGFRDATYFPVGTELPTQSVGEKIISALTGLTFYRTNKPIPEIGDRGLVTLPIHSNGQIVRLALQSKAAKTVVVNGPALDRMAGEDRSAFFIHEALIRVFNDDLQNSEGLASTEKLAALVKALVKSKPRAGLSAKSVARYLCDAGIMAIGENLSGMHEVRGLLSMKTIYPKSVIVFAKNETSCHAKRLNLAGPGHAEIWKQKGGELKSTARWTFTTEDVGAASNEANILLNERVDGQPELWIIADQESNPFAFVGRGHDAIQSQRMSVWAY